jgi:ADP-ribose pyrophosphatase YjhB (NUDIX family)
MGRRQVIQAAARAVNCIRRRYWRLLNRPVCGVAVIAFTPYGKIILVRHTYIDGWGLPGGSLRRKETPVVGALRELKEEIGLKNWGQIRYVTTLETTTSEVKFKVSIVAIDEAEFSFRSNFEIEEASAFHIDSMPEDTNSWSKRVCSKAGLIV